MKESTLLPGGELLNESDSSLNERSFPLRSREEPDLDFCLKSAVRTSLSETIEGLAFN